jgi:hypothetical protein
MTEHMLHVLGREILGITCGPIQEKGKWRRRWNSEICSLYKDLNMVDDVKIRRLGWAGHVIRLEEGRIGKNVPNEKIYKERSVGKPRTKWVEVVQRECIRIPRNTRFEEMSWGWRRIKAPFEGGQGPEGAAAP